MYYYLMLWLLHSSCTAHQEQCDFITSFINNYGFCSNAYDAREYHPFIMHQTKQSFENLESHLSQKDFNAIGRILILGYQENAMAPYYTKKYTDHIHDEFAVKTEVGWRFAAGNTAGFMTGFALQHANHFPQQYLTHIAPECIELFDPHATLFHKHAFGESYNHALTMHRDTLRALRTSSNQCTLRTLAHWWKTLYRDACRDGAGNVVATQDMLFTIAYAEYLLHSGCPILHWYTGPDITYPIEVLPCQPLHATYGAQCMLQQLHALLNKSHAHKTAYIFCSFIDGVGKSTLLGNLRNWQQYGTSFERYKRVDNSSSQHATLYHYNDDVVIVDLPAQVSHHTIKPDGAVYTDIRTMAAFSNDYREKLVVHIHTKLPTLMQQAQQCHTPYTQLCTLLKRTDTPWIPFSYENHDYLVHKDNVSNIKVLVPFTGVHSYGLKTIEPEHMLFNEIHFPMPYKDFLHELSDQLHRADVQDVIFVDFISIYPRTSREIIRVNFLLQQLYTLHNDTFNQTKSFYHHTPHPHDYYLMLTHHEKDVINAITHETLLRNAWYDLLINRPSDLDTSISIEALSQRLSERINALSEVNAHAIKQTLAKKVAYEKEEFERTWAHDKVFETIVRFDHNILARFSSWMHRLFAHTIKDPYYNALWNRQDTEIVYTIHKALSKACRDPVLLQEIIPLLRAQWYAILSNILGLYIKDGDWFAQEYPLRVPPLWIEAEESHQWRIVSKKLSEYETEQPTAPKPFFDTRTSTALLSWGVFNNTLHCTSWNAIDTARGLYAYAYNPDDASHNTVTTVLRTWLQQHEATMRIPYITPQELVQLLKTSDCFSKKSTVNPYVKQCNKQAAQLFVRAIATLDMILKDPTSPCVARTGNMQDFKALLLLTERITLPHYFGISFKSPLFENYDTVKPVV